MILSSPKLTLEHPNAAWAPNGLPYKTEEEAIAYMMSIYDTNMSYRIMKVKLPYVAVPDDFEVIECKEVEIG